jgi:hypothetical protein
MKQIYIRDIILILLALFWIVIVAVLLITVTSCGTIKTESTVHTDPVKIELSGSAIVTLAIKADPTVANLVGSQCNNNPTCMNVTTASLTNSLNQTLINLGIVK